ncbi:unnamed protein product [Heligmosomoides polygyrus]|uniref:WAPL domain-containing protein n=1 Tax=Heligmosomoides polygyrus TaxID=6339 RepID=A0A183F356_HELPZ|nr:unnamed protein product [Heligmosomoides polygyrus]
MEEGEGTPRMRFVAGQCGRDDKKPYMRMLQAGQKRSIRDRSPERNSDEDIDIMGDTPSSQPSTPRGAFQKRMKAAKEPKTGSGAGDPPTKWIFFEAMQSPLDFIDEEPTMSNVGQYGHSSAGTSTVHYAASESSSGSNSPALSTFGFRADVPRKTALEKKKEDASKIAVLSRICDELRIMNQSQQTVDQFDAFGVFASTTLRKLAASDEEAAEWTVLELTEHLTKLVREALARKRSVR